MYLPTLDGRPHLQHYILVTIVGCICITPFFQTDFFTDPFLTPKTLFVQVVIGAVFLVVASLYLRKQAVFVSLCRVDAIIGLFALLCVVSIMAHDYTMFHENFSITWFSLIAFYFLMRLSPLANIFPKVVVFLVGTGLVLAFIGLLQFIGVIDNGMPDFPVNGFALNPGMYAFHLASIFPCALSIALFWTNAPKWTKKVCLVTCLFIFASVAATASRTSIISILITLAMMGLLKAPKTYFEKYLGSLAKRTMAFTSILILASIIGYQLYQYKKDSADGRLFIWEIATSIIKDHIIFGVGFDRYGTAHNDYQAKYFIEHPTATVKGYLAGNVEFSFNEYLQTWAELGIVGVLLLLVFIYTVIRNGIRVVLSDKSWLLIAALGGMISILISCLFFYPLHDIPTLVNFFLFSAIISANLPLKSYEVKTGKSLFAVVILLSVLFIYWRVDYSIAERTWKVNYWRIRAGNVDTAIEEYRKIYPILKSNKYFLYNYAAELDARQQYSESVKLFLEAERRLNDHDLYNSLGAAYEGVNDPVNAERSFLKSTYIIPHLIYPKFRLAILYHVTGNTDMAKRMAYVIINMKPKVESEEADRMKYVVQTVILEGRQL